jgi:hypothetical protein
MVISTWREQQRLFLEQSRAWKEPFTFSGEIEAGTLADKLLDAQAWKVGVVANFISALMLCPFAICFDGLEEDMLWSNAGVRRLDTAPMACFKHARLW